MPQRRTAPVSEHHCDEARGPIVAVIGLHDASQGPLCVRSSTVEKCYHHQFCSLKHKNGNQYIFNGNLAWLNVWHNISRRPCEINGWFPKTTYRKSHIASPMVTWPLTSRDSKRPRSWPQNFWGSRSQKTLRDGRSVQIDNLWDLETTYCESGGHVTTRGRVRAGPSLQLGTLSTRIALYSRRCRASPGVLTHAGRGTHSRAWRPSAACQKRSWSDDPFRRYGQTYRGQTDTRQ